MQLSLLRELIFSTHLCMHYMPEASYAFYFIYQVLTAVELILYRYIADAISPLALDRLRVDSEYLGTNEKRLFT